VNTRNLPLEVMQHIARFLDVKSVNILARTSKYENNALNPVMDESVCTRLYDEPSANASNFVQSRKRPLEDISSPEGDGMIPKSKKTRNSSSENSSLSVPVIDECISTRLCDDLSVNASNLLQSRKTPLEEINNPDDDPVTNYYNICNSAPLFFLPKF